MQDFVALRSDVLKKMTFDVAIFGNYPDIANRNEIHSDDRYTIYRLLNTCFMRWFESPLASGLVATSHVSYHVINKRYSAPFGHEPAEIAERFAESLNDIVFIDIFAFTTCFAFVF